jgi:hypothetical protein
MQWLLLYDYAQKKPPMRKAACNILQEK